MPEGHSLKKLSHNGLIVGEEEADQEFLKRAQRLLSKKKKEDSPILQQVNAQLQKDFNITIHWIEEFYSNKHLAPWQGAMTYIYQNEKGDLIPKLQIRKTFLFKKYSIKEIVTHEMVHVARMAFENCRFEELLASSTSPKPLSRFLGGLFRSTTESLIFLGITIASAASFFLELPTIYEILFFSLLGATPLFFLLRLTWDHWILKRCLQRVSKIFPAAKSLAVVLHLTDHEICLFALKPLKTIRLYIENQKTLRWKQIFATFSKHIHN